MNGTGFIPHGSSRERRVVLLLIGIVLFSLADLVITLTHLRTIGMMEANPIAAYLIRTTNSGWALAAYKIATVALCVIVLYVFRRVRTGEIAAWISIAILVGMSVIWHSYTAHFSDVDELMLAHHGAYGEHWLFLD